MNTDLKSARKSLHLTQKELAEKSGISLRGYQTYEYGKRFPRADVALKIAKALNREVEDLFRRQTDTSPTPPQKYN